MKSFLVVTFGCLLAFGSTTVEAESPSNGRFVWTSDGNDHDSDDILGNAVMLPIIAANGAQKSMPVLIYADHIWETKEQEKDMLETIQETIDLWGGFEHLEIYNAYREEQNNPGLENAAVQAMVREINKSTEANPLTIATAGPNQIVVEALRAADPDKLPFITVVGHGVSTFNDNHGGARHGGYKYQDLVATGVKIVKLANQNGRIKYPDEPTRFKIEFDEVSHWEDHENACLRLLWQRGQKARSDYFDGSDAGIAWWYYMGQDEDGNFDKLEEFILESLSDR